MVGEYGLLPLWPLYLAAAVIVVAGLLLAWWPDREDS